MTQSKRRSLHILLAALPILLAALLILSAVRTFRALDGQREVYLRSRVAALAAHLESTPPENWAQTLADEEPALLSFEILTAESAPPALAPLLDGRELFRTESLPSVFRAYIPFHSNGQLRLARLDLAASSADFLTEHAAHHLALVVIGGALIVLFTLLSFYIANRHAELQHLASLGAMSASLAHEIRNPLGTIKGFAQLLQEQLRGQHAPYLNPILTETSRLESLVKDLLLYGRAAEPRFQSVPASQIAETLQTHAAAASIPFETAVSPLTLSTDPNLLEQVLLNLLRNAADAVRDTPHPAIRLVIEPDGPRHALLRLADNGPGLSPEAARRLFEPFFTTKASGTGLGLSISKKLAAALGGALTLNPVPSGGLAAELRLPLEKHV